MGDVRHVSSLSVSYDTKHREAWTLNLTFRNDFALCGIYPIWGYAALRCNIQLLFNIVTQEEKIK